MISLPSYHLILLIALISVPLTSIDSAYEAIVKGRPVTDAISLVRFKRYLCVAIVFVPLLELFDSGFQKSMLPQLLLYTGGGGIAWMSLGKLLQMLALLSKDR